MESCHAAAAVYLTCHARTVAGDWRRTEEALAGRFCHCFSSDFVTLSLSLSLWVYCNGKRTNRGRVKRKTSEDSFCGDSQTGQEQVC